MEKKSEREGNTGEKGNMAMNKYLSINTKNVNGLNAPIKRHRVAERIRKHDLYICCLQKTHIVTKDLQKLKAKGWKKYSKQLVRIKIWGSNIHITLSIFQKPRPLKETEKDTS